MVWYNVFRACLKIYFRPLGGRFARQYKKVDKMNGKIDLLTLYNQDKKEFKQKLSSSEMWDMALARRNQLLKTHLSNVSKLAREFGGSFGMEEILGAAGYLHDYGKGSPQWQEYLIKKLMYEEVPMVSHSIHGAKYCFTEVNSFQHIAEMLGNIIMSHHGSLYDNISPDGETVLKDVLTSKTEVKIPEEFSIDFKLLNNEFVKIINSDKNADKPFYMSMLIKLAYSCLVDADRLDAFFVENSELYSSTVPEWNDLILNLEKKISKLQDKEQSKMSILRKKVSEDCKTAGLRDIGIYKLEVATGGGKTFASLRFALEHARHHKLDRIIYVIPYLSIISQTAKAIRNALDLDDNMVLEHHSGFLPDDEQYYKLHTDRWDATIIITTQVQFLESLFSARGSDLRKFHNMANSILIFDEAQSIPIKCIHLFNSAMNFINKICKSTVLLCTATQPPFESALRKLMFSTHPSLTEYMEPPKRYEIRNQLKAGGYTYPELAEFVMEKAQKSTLVILNTKKAVKLLYKELHGRGIPVFHLSNLMCSTHLNNEFEKIITRLEEDKPVLCISSQLIEAGVDISFECVIRDLAGLDSIFQAAGRCNRHGKPEIGNVYVINIRDEDLSRLPDIKKGAAITRRLFNENKIYDINLYYNHYFYTQQSEMDYNIDGGSVYDLLSCNKQGQGAYLKRKDKQGMKPPAIWSAIRSAADEFYVINKGRVDIIVHYGESMVLLEQYNIAKDIADKRKILKKLGGFSISLYQYQLDALKRNGAVDDRNYKGLTVLKNRFYDKIIGLNF